jgi:hypothetical protein
LGGKEANSFQVIVVIVIAVWKMHVAYRPLCLQRVMHELTRPRHFHGWRIAHNILDSATSRLTGHAFNLYARKSDALAASRGF